MAFWEDRGGLSVRLDHAKEAYLVETLFELTEVIDPSLPRAERREILRKRVSFFSWSSVANFFVTVSKSYASLDDLRGFYINLVRESYLDKTNIASLGRLDPIR